MEAEDIFLALIKALGICATAGFGVVGMLTEFRDTASKRITRWGKIALLGAATSAVLSLSIHSVEVWNTRTQAAKSAKKTQDELARSNELLTQISRTLERVDLDQLQLRVGVFVSMKEAGLAAYKRRLDGKIDELKKQLERSGRTLIDVPEQGLQLLQTGGDKQNRLFLTIFPGSAFWPDPGNIREAPASRLLNRVGLVVDVKSPKFPDHRDDLSMVFAGSTDGRPGRKSVAQTNAHLLYDMHRERISLHLRELPNLSPVDPSRAFLSVVDFEGSEVEVTLPGIPGSLPSLSLGEFQLGFGRGVRSLRVFEWERRGVSNFGKPKFRAKLAYRVEDQPSWRDDPSVADKQQGNNAASGATR